MIEAIEDEEANTNEAAASPTDDALDPDTFVKSGFLSMRKDEKPRLTLKGSLRTVMKEYNL